jgi:hypothetical protein
LSGEKEREGEREMGTVSHDAINQFKALMDQGSILIPFYLFISF